jgi:hypothetical protein
MRISQSLLLVEKWIRKQNLRPEKIRIHNFQSVQIPCVYPYKEPFSLIFSLIFLLAGVSAAVGQQAQRPPGFTH